MSSLLNSTWTLSAVNRDFLTLTAQFLPDNVVKITFSNGMDAIGTWSEGKRHMSFHIQFSYPGPAEEEYNGIGSHQEGQGSGVFNIEWSGGVQKSAFAMVKKS